jgi:hypothetical protein
MVSLPFRITLFYNFSFRISISKIRTKFFVLNCARKIYGQQSSEVTWHRFPSNENLLDTWIKEIFKDNSGMDLKNISFEDVRICSQNFEKKYFQITKTGKHNLIKGSVLTIFPSSNPQVKTTLNNN